MARLDLQEKLAQRAAGAKVPVVFCDEPLFLVQRSWMRYQVAGEIASRSGTFQHGVFICALIALSLEDATGQAVFDVDDPASIAALTAAAPADIRPLSTAVLQLYGLTQEARDAQGKGSAPIPSGDGSSTSPAPVADSPAN